MRKIRPVTKRTLQAFLKKNPHWKVNKAETQLSCVFATPDFVSGLVYAARITVHAELLNHHPDIELKYGSLKVMLTTHDCKCLTKLDIELAQRIDRVSARMVLQ